MRKEEKTIAQLLRKILIKTIVPIRNKQEKIKKRIRLSIRLRIAYTYGKIMVINSMIILLIFFFAFIKICEDSFVNEIDLMTAEIEQDSTILEEGLLECGEDVSMRIVAKGTKKIIYDDMEKYYVDKCNFFDSYISGKAEKTKLIIVEKRQVNIENEDCFIYFQIDFSKEIIVFKELFWFMALIIVVLTVIFVSGGAKQIIPIFKPIKQMAEAADRMTVNNLSSERLNLEGTKNELKDLAMTINRMLDRLDTSYESQKQFVSDASHELRTPIAVIQGYVNLLDRWGKSDEAVMDESIEAIKNESQAMKDLVEKLLFLSRHDKKTLKLDKKIFNIRPVVEEMIKETKLVAKDRIIDTKYLEDTYIYADKQSIKQALRIFIDNAIKYSEDGDSVYISCKTNEYGGCLLEVEDTGLGMTQRDVDNIFERFYRSDNVRNKKISGNGLGLSLAKLIVLKHTGTIILTTQLNKGSSFKLSFPTIKY